MTTVPGSMVRGEGATAGPLAAPRRGAPAREVAVGFPYRVPYYMPYWSGGTYRALARCLASGAVVRGPDVARLSERLARGFGVPAVVPCGSGGVALELALRATRAVGGAEVIVPTFCCPQVLPPILAVGSMPVLVDVGEDLNLTPEGVEDALTRRTRAVLVPHLFGNPADIAAIADLCRPRGVAVIDDAAQALGATLQGRTLGTFGEAGLVSFGNGKVCFGTGGGLLVSRDPEVLRRAAQVDLPASSWSAGIGRALSVLLFRRWRRWSYPLRQPLARFRRPAAWRPQPYRREAMRNLDAAVAWTLLDTLEENLRGRRLRAALYGRLLATDPRLRAVAHRPGSACTKQILEVRAGRPDGEAAQAVIDALRRDGYEVARSYTPLHLSAEYREFARGPLEVAERVWRRLIELPCEPSVRLPDVERMCGIVREAVR